MEVKKIAQGILSALLQLLGIAAIVWLIVKLQDILIYFVIAAVISLIGRPLILLFHNKLKMGMLMASSLTIVVLLSIGFGVISLFVPLLVQQGENLSLLNIDVLEQNVTLLVGEISNYFNLDSSFWSQQISAPAIFDAISLQAVPDFLNSILSILGNFTIGLLSVIFISFFLLKDSKMLERIILTLVNDAYTTKAKTSMENIKNLLSRYFIGLVIQISILLVIYVLVLALFGIENAFIIAFLCALLNLIPFLGPIIGGILMIILTMTSNLDASFSEVILPKTIYVLIGFIFGQLVDNVFSQPFIFSNSVKSHPLEIFIVILAAGTLSGPIGMIVAIPTYTALKVILKTFYADNKIVQSVTKKL